MAADDDGFDAAYQPIYGRMYALAWDRGGYLSDPEAERCGLRRELAAVAVARGHLERVSEGVLRIALGAPSAHSRIVTAWVSLGPRGVVSCRSALALLELCEPDNDVHLTLPPEAREDGVVAPPGVVIHFAELSRDERTYRAGVPCAIAARALEDAARDGLDPALIGRARAVAVRRKLTAPPAGAADAPVVPDAALRLALLGALDQTTPVSALAPDALREWAARAPLPPERFPLGSLRWAADDPLWPALPPGHDGVVRDLAGIEHYTALRVLDLRASELADLRPLAALADLEAAHLGVTRATDLETLAACESLARVRLHGYDPAAHGPARERLEAQGVRVDPAGSTVRASAAPFADPMLKLAVLEALASGGAVELPELVQIDEYELDRENLDRLIALPLSEAQLASVVELYWAGGGMDLQHRVWPQFDGESDDFAIRSLSGIECLPNLRRLHLENVGSETDFDPALLDRLRAHGVTIEIV